MSEWEPTQPHEPTGPQPSGPGPNPEVEPTEVWAGTTPVGGTVGPVGPVDPVVPTEPGYVAEPLPDEPIEPWYRQRGPVAAVIGVGLAMLFLLIAFLIWVFSDDDEQLATTDSTTTTSVVVTVAPTSTVTTVATATTSTSSTTEPPTTEPPVTEPPATTAPPSTVSPTIVAPPPPTAAPTTAAPTTAAPTTAAPTTAAPTTTPPTTQAPQVTVPPSGDATVWDIVAASPDLSRLRDLLVFADLDDEIDGAGPLTLLAPSNDAFDLLESSPGGAALLSDRERVRDLLLRHVLDAALSGDELFDLDEVTAANGDVLPIDARAGTIDGSRVVITDVDGANGVLHVLDRVMVP